MTVRAWAELLRVSALFTVPGDALAGAASAGVRPNRGTALAVGASLCLYEAGMALNDWADRDEDAVERPHRPIPSGRITPNAALAAAGGLTATGLLLASRAGRPALALSTALAATVWAYDIRLKHTAAGPAAMGAARALDVLLGATATYAASRRTPIRPASPRTLTFSPPPRRGALTRLSAWATGSKPAPAGAPRSEAAASTARFSAPPGGRGALARLSAWADGSVGQGRTAPPAGGSANKLTGSASEAAASTARFPSPSGGRGALARLSALADGSAGQGRSVSSVSKLSGSASGPAASRAGFSSPSTGQGVLAKLTGSAARQMSEAAASTARFPSPSGGRGALARLSAWIDGSAGQGRTAPPVGGLTSRLAEAASEAAASTARSSSPAGRGAFARLSAWADGSAPPGRTATWGGSPASALPPGWGSGSALPPGPGRHAIPRGALLPAALLGVHTVAVTGVSRSEVYGGSVGAPVVALAVTGVLGGVVGRPRDPGVGALVTAALAAVYAVTAGRAFLHAALNPSPQLTQRAVGGGIRAMIPFQAALAARGGTPAVGLAVMGLVPLARKLAKKVSVT